MCVYNVKSQVFCVYICILKSILCNILYQKACQCSSVIKNTTFLMSCINFYFDAGIYHSLDAEQKLLSFGGLIRNYKQIVTRTGREGRQRSSTALEGFGTFLLLPFSHLIPFPQAFPGERFGCFSAVRTLWLSGKSLDFLR